VTAVAATKRRLKGMAVEVEQEPWAGDVDVDVGVGDSHASRLMTVTGF
jgi:hypothetical protein